MTTTRTEWKRARRGLSGGWLVAALLVVTLAPTRAAHGQTSEERVVARGHFNRGVELARGGEYDGALAEFEQAYRIAPHFSVLYNIGQAELALERSRAAVESFERYLAEGGEQIDPTRRAEVAAIIAAERERWGATDSEPSGASAHQPETEPKHAPEERPQPAAAEPRSANVAAPPLEPRRAEARRERGGDVKRPLAYVLGAAGVALAAAATAHYAWNRGRYEDWQDAYAEYYEDPRPVRRSEANSLAESIDRASRVTAGLAIGAGVMLGGGAVLFFSSSAPASAQARAGDGWISVRGQF